MKRLILTASICILVSLSFGAFAQNKTATHPTKPQFVVMSTEDANAVIEAYRTVNDRQKDLDLAVAKAAAAEADAASNAGVTRKEYFVSRDKDGNLGFELRPPAPEPNKK